MRTSYGYAWWDNKRQEFRHIYGKKLQVQMCFPDFGENAQNRGEGEIVPVTITERIEGEV